MPTPPPLATDLAAAGLRLEVAGSRATISLDRPERRNAQDPAMWRALRDVGAGLPGDVRVVVVRGEGPSFSAGLDRRMFTAQGIPGETSLVEMAAMDDVELDAFIVDIQAAFTWWRDPARVTVAAVQGHAVGAGFQLALACDLRVLADDAQLAMREPTLGLVPDLLGTLPLVESVGYARALEICATGRWVGAEEALRIGLANAVVPKAELDAAVDRLVEALLDTPAGAVRATKALLQRAVAASIDEQGAAERAAQRERLRQLAAGAS